MALKSSKMANTNAPGRRTLFCVGNVWKQSPPCCGGAALITFVAYMTRGTR